MIWDNVVGWMTATGKMAPAPKEPWIGDADQPDIKISPAMLKAGARMFGRANTYFDDGDFFAEQIYRAMEQARISECGVTGATPDLESGDASRGGSSPSTRTN